MNITDIYHSHVYIAAAGSWKPLLYLQKQLLFYKFVRKFTMNFVEYSHVQYCEKCYEFSFNFNLLNLFVQNIVQDERYMSNIT